MKIYIVHIGNLRFYPPVLTLINMLEKKNVECIVITTKQPNQEGLTQKSEYRIINVNYETNKGIFQKFFGLFRIKRKIWKLIQQDYREDDIIWCTYNVSLKHLGKKIIKYNYIIQLMELMESIRYYHKIPLLKMNAKKICDGAMAVVVPEYNRAHIQKAFWNLKEIPLILCNKPLVNIDIKKNSEIYDEYAKKIITKLRGKKIILYQGVVNKERPLDSYINAISKMGDDYAFVVMSSSENIYANHNSSNFYYIPYVSAPYHLQITSHATLGILSYVSTKSDDFSSLNALYCAPNKIYEYSMFGIPMIGNDIPGLKFVFETNNIGEVVNQIDENDIILTIEKILKNYDIYSSSSYNFYRTTNYNEQLDNIFKSCGIEIKGDDSY